MLVREPLSPKNTEIVEKFKSDMIHVKGRSKPTAVGYRTEVNQFLRYIDKDYDQVTKEDIEDFIRWRHEEGNEPATLNRKVSAIRVFFSYLVKKGLLEHNPSADVELFKLKQTIPRPLSLEQVKKVRNACRDLREIIIIDLLFATGIRREELVSLKKSDVDFDEEVIRVTGKGNKERIIPMHEEVLNKLSTYFQMNTYEHIFASRKNPKTHITTRHINEIVSNIGERAKVKGLTPHKLRHTFGTHLYDNGADIKAIQEMMGHASIDTTNIYANSSLKRNKEEYKKNHPLYK